MKKSLSLALWHLLLLYGNYAAGQCLSGNCQSGSGVYVFPSGARYVGLFKDGVPSGVGSCAYTDGRKYQGEWLNGQIHGKGMMIYPDGSRIKGQWQLGHLVRQEEVRGATSEWMPRNTQTGCVSGDCVSGYGVYIFPSGAVYSGQFKNGEVHGYGVCDYSDGSRYQGEWKQRFPDGTGTKIWPDGSRRTGRWERGQPVDDQGNLLDALIRMKPAAEDNADIQSGCLSGNCVSGAGVMAYSDGSRYEGAFQAGKPHGQGVFRYANGAVYKGDFWHGLPHGQGVLVRPDDTQLHGQWAEGEFVAAESAQASTHKGCIQGNCQNGVGVYVYKNGTKYTGEFSNNLPHGTGTAVYPNGEKYEGQWMQAAFHGQGTLYLNNGTPVNGYWQNGVWMGQSPPVPLAADSAPTAPLSAKPKIWALIVGVAAYHHMPTLRYTDDDAYRLYAFLKSPGGGAIPDDQIRILIDESATRDQIIASMREVFGRAGSNDMILAYFSGHGLKGAFLPFDFDGYGNKLLHEDITQSLRHSRAKYKLCIVDACHSGSLLAMRSSQPQLIATFYDQLAQAEGGTALFLSSKSEETSLESSGLRQGVFSHFLIRGLKGEADANSDLMVTIQELYEYVYVQVRAYTGMLQSPVITGQYDPKMVVGVVVESH